jgi:hypothetical protein
MNPPETPYEKPTVVLTLGLKKLLEDDAFVRSIHVAGPDVRALLGQLQLDSTTPQNMHEVGPMCAALRKVQEALFLVEERGKLLKAKDDKASKKK